MAERRTSVRLSVVGGSQVRAELASIGNDGQRSLERMAKATQPAGVGLRALDAVAGEAQQIDAFAGRVGPAGAALGVMGPAGLAAAAGIGAMVAAIGVGLRDLTEAERLSIRLDQVLRATGYAAGLTGADIGAMAADIDRATLATAEEVQQAAAVLATFRSVQGDTFREALVLAQDLSAVFSQSLTGSASQLGPGRWHHRAAPGRHQLHRQPARADRDPGRDRAHRRGAGRHPAGARGSGRRRGRRRDRVGHAGPRCAAAGGRAPGHGRSRFLRRGGISTDLVPAAAAAPGTTVLGETAREIRGAHEPGPLRSDLPGRQAENRQQVTKFSYTANRSSLCDTCCAEFRRETYCSHVEHLAASCAASEVVLLTKWLSGTPDQCAAMKRTSRNDLQGGQCGHTPLSQRQFLDR